jgi:hypothetical protein
MGSTHRRWQALLAPLAVAITSAAMIITVPTAASAAPSAGNTGLLRTVSKGTALPFPSGQTVGTPAGVQSPEIPRDPDERDPSVSVRRTAATISPAGVPVVRPVPVTGSTGLVRSFHGLDGFDQRFANGGNQFSVEPPDQGMCVGARNVIEMTNDVLQVFTKTGSAASPVTDLNTFYGYPAAIDRTTGLQGPFVTDPSCIYDAGTSRFYLVVLTLEVVPDTGAFTGNNTLDLAVSQTANPLGGWNIYRLPVQDDGTQGTPSHTGCPCIGDYPHIGADKNGIYLTTNQYPFSDDPGVFGNNFNGAQIYLLDKAALAAGAATSKVVQFENTQLAGAATRTPGFTVWPANVPDTAYQTANNGTEYFLSSIAGEEAQPDGVTGRADAIGVWQVTNSASIRTASPAPVLSSALLASQRYVVPPLSAQRVGPTPLADCVNVACQPNIGPGREAEGPLDSNDSRMQQVYYAGGRLYGALDTAAQVTGRLQAGIAWFVVRPGSSPAAASMANQGYLAVARNNVTYPAIAVDSSGRGAMAFTLVGQNYFPTAAYALVSGRSVAPSVKIASAGKGPQDGFSEYGFFSAPDPARPRWGDYGAAQPQGGKIWIASEYIGQSCRLATFQVDPTCGGTRAPLINWGTRISAINP